MSVTNSRTWSVRWVITATYPRVNGSYAWPAASVRHPYTSRPKLFWQDRIESISDRVLYCTDDGTFGVHGFVTDALRELIESGEDIDEVDAIGPMPMMRATCELTRPYGIYTVVSLDSLMVDGTGMCGGCRVTVDGEVKFTCVDGPEFDGHKVDFDELAKRKSAYHEHEQRSCRLFEQELAARGKVT